MHKGVGIAVLGVLITSILAAAFFFDDRADRSLDTAHDPFIVSPQEAVDVVVIDSVIMPRDGYAVIRGVENNRLSQIIEISDHLTVGPHSNLTIDLGDFYSGGQELIAMIYADNGDGVFNDLDKPAQDPAGTIIARYVKTGFPVPQDILKMNTDSGGHTMGNIPLIQVRYTDTGFEPATLEVSVGTMVEFVNKSTKSMWVASNEHPAHSILPTFDEFETVDFGGTYSYVFDKKGTWAYHDHIHPAAEGVVVVI